MGNRTRPHGWKTHELESVKNGSVSVPSSAWRVPHLFPNPSSPKSMNAKSRRAALGLAHAAATPRCDLPR
jgi:hypothetical protein